MEEDKDKEQEFWSKAAEDFVTGNINYYLQQILKLAEESKNKNEN